MDSVENNFSDKTEKQDGKPDLSIEKIEISDESKKIFDEQNQEVFDGGVVKNEGISKNSDKLPNTEKPPTKNSKEQTLPQTLVNPKDHDESTTDSVSKNEVKSSPSKNAGKVSVYNVKWIEYEKESLPIVTQNENGPCPLLAIINFLFLQRKITLNHSKNIVESPELTSLLANYILEHVHHDVQPDMKENLEQKVNDAISMIPSLITGLDVNVRFTGIKDFEYTSDIEIFDLLTIPLYHGWLVEPELEAVREVIKDNSYNQLVVKVVHQQSSDNATLVQEALIAEEFLNSTASQLTYHGLCELSSALQNHQMGVLFRNNHFLNILKHQDSLYVLATDQGFLNEAGVVWESLTNIEGDSHFYDSNFKLFRQTPEGTKKQKSTSSNVQISNDYLVALALQQDEAQSSNQPPLLNDQELAQSLQLEEQKLQALEDSNKIAVPAEASKQKRTRPEAAASSQASSSKDSQATSSTFFKSVKESCLLM